MVDATQIVQLVAQRDRARFATLGKPAPRGIKRELPQVRQAGLPPGCEGDAGHSPSYVPMRSVRGSTRSVRDALEGALAAAYGGAAKKGALKFAFAAEVADEADRLIGDGALKRARGAAALSAP